MESLWEILKGYWKAAGKCPDKTDTYFTNVPIG
jgi:hypothetical protein